MMIKQIRWLSRAAVASSCVLACAQSSVDDEQRFAWGENIGWTNWLPGEPDPDDGVLVYDSWLGGWIWAENVGWITLGDGDPGAPGGAETSYANITGADFGVNRDAGNLLTGYAWGENIGWINFAGGSLANPANPARIDSGGGECRLRGFVWGENVGWINLDHSVQYVGLVGDACGDDPCPGDLDGDGDRDDADLGLLLNSFNVDDGGDIDGDSDTDDSDLGLLLNFFGIDCP